MIRLILLFALLAGCGTNPLTPPYVAGKSMEITRVICSQGNVSFLGTLLPFMGKVDSTAVIQTPGAKQKLKSAKITSDGACTAEFEHDEDKETEETKTIDAAVRRQ